MFTLTGLLKVKNDTQQINDTFKKREFVVTDNSSQYPQDILFQLTQARCDVLDPFNEGEEVSVTFNLRGREWTNPKDGQVRYFNSLDVWKMEKAAGFAETPLPQEPPAEVASSGADMEDDLPF
jgi:hypothetical protein